ncbi:DUF5662 family protein [Anaerobium acetethylicum]|uniref:Catalase n=1 Tax=Anaerobium acetethylicum TaxID=1619234 RepID=A0A1D3TP74_9FIRM|nr:DUF5662 family protein [Anaerobium acetethylicum]SCP95190.1 hypothetical protein SAMN05421730_1001384 [Anaerobium acetethylicum]
MKDLKIVKHFTTITKHHLMVRKYCFSVGLYRQGLLHDMSKYSLSEFLVGCRYFQGTRSPNNAERENRGYSSAWLHHKGRNKHHYEYWLDYSAEYRGEIVGMRMPEQYVVEMFFDRIAASKVYLASSYTDRSPLEYYEAGKIKFLHDDTKSILETLLNKLADEGEEAAIAYIKADVLKKK